MKSVVNPKGSKGLGLVDYFGRLSFFVSAISLMTLLGLGLFAAVLAFESSVRTSLQRELRLAADQLSAELLTIHQELSNLASNPLVVNSMFDPEGRFVYLSTVVEEHSLVKDRGFLLRLVDANNETIEVQRANNAPDPLELFDNALSESQPGAVVGNSLEELLNSLSLPVSGEPFYGVLRDASDQPVLVARIPVLAPPAGQLAGAVDLIFPLQNLTFKLPALAPGRFWNLSSETFSLYVPNPRTLTDQSKGWQETAELRAAFIQDHQQFQGLSLALIETENPMLGAFKTLSPFAFLTFCFGLLTSWILARRYARKAAQPIVSLTRAIERISSHGLQEDFDVGSGQRPLEIELLQTRFGDMLRRLRQSQDQLELVVEQRTKSLVRAQQEIADRSQRMGEILRLSPDGFVEVLASGSVGFVNPAFEVMTGLTSAALLGRSQKEFEGLLAGLESSDSKGIPTAHPLPIESSALPLESSAFAQVLRAPLRESSEELLRIIQIERPWRRVLAAASFQSDHGSRLLFVRDVTREADVDRMKADFLSTAAHELRTPLSSIQGFAELLLRRSDLDDATRKDGLETILRHAGSMRELIDDLLLLAREEARVGRDHVMQIRTLTPVLRRVAGDFRQPNDPRMIVLRLDDHLPAVRFDADRMGQVLLNLLSNAHKYSPRGSAVELATVVREDAETGLAWVGFRVKDYGMGMTEAEQARLFERFFRANPRGDIPGTGLGMALVQEIVKQHGGRLEVVSAKDKGTAITVLLPQIFPDAQSSPTAAALSEK